MPTNHYTEDMEIEQIVPELFNSDVRPVDHNQGTEDVRLSSVFI